MIPQIHSLDDYRTPCGGCNLILPKIGGPTHPYMLSSPACWQLYGEVLAREYSDKDYWQVHRLTVDAYALQHSGSSDRRAIQSVNVHLASLYLIFEKGYNFNNAAKFMARLIKQYKNRFIYLKRPEELGNTTILDVWNARSAKQHTRVVKNWAKSTWEAWHEHRLYIASIVGKIIIG